MASAASAQQAVAVAASAQKAVTLPPAPQQTPFPVVTATPRQNGIPRIEMPFIELPHIELPDVHIDFEAIREGVAMAQQVTSVPTYNFSYQEKGQVESQYSQARQRITITSTTAPSSRSTV